MNTPVEAERATIGALIQAPELLTLVPSLRGRHFADPMLGAVFAACEWANAQTGVAPDAVMVVERLRQTGMLRGTLTASVVVDLIEAAIHVVNVPWYAAQVMDAARRRALANAAHEAVSTVESQLDDDALADRMDTILANLGELAAPITVGSGGRIEGLAQLGSFIDEPDGPSSGWLIPGLLRAMERVVIVAAEGSGKTMIARAVACAVAAGRHPFAPETRIEPATTLLVDLENPPSLIRSKTRPMVQTLRDWGSWDENRCHLWSRPGGIDLRKSADALLFERVVETVRPRLICFGPVYKAFLDTAGERDSQAAREVMGVLDHIREKYGCALWIEHHAPLDQGGTRKFRPFGSSLWLRWPEFGLALPFTEPGDPGCTSLRVERWRGDRDEREWPTSLARGRRGWPWEATWDSPGGMPEWIRLGMPFEETG